MRPDRKGGRRERTLPAGGGGVHAASPSSSPPLGWGAGNPAPSPLPWSPRARLGAHRESGREVRASGSGAHSHPWGIRTPGSAAGAARGAMPFGLPADRNRGAASSFGERSRRRGPRARGGAELGRGPRAPGRRAGRGAPGAGGHAAGRPTRPLRPSLARATPPLGLPLPPQLPPTPIHLPTRRGRILPLHLAVVPLQILGRALAAKGSEMHKDAGKEGGSGRGVQTPSLGAPPSPSSTSLPIVPARSTPKSAHDAHR